MRFSALPLLMQGKNGQSAVGWLYLGVAGLLNAVLLWRSLQLYQRPDHPRARSLFKYSMVYLALLFLAMAVDRAHWICRCRWQVECTRCHDNYGAPS